MSNPFTIAFGREPNNIIRRQKQIDQVKDTFIDENPLTYSYLITGVRGSGKTVLLSGICEEFKREEDWIVIELNPDRDLLESFAAKLYENSHLKFSLLKKELSFSFHGLIFSIDGENPVHDVENLLERILKVLNRHHKKVLVAIDEVSNNKELRAFVHTFQILSRQKLDIFLVMTGLYENVKNIENDKTLTFLYRAPKIDIEPLDLLRIKNSYMELLHVDSEIAVKLSKLTNGYAFGYQTLGYLMYEKGNVFDEKIINRYDEFLSEYVYDKIWSELSEVYRNILKVLCNNDDGDVETIYKTLNMKKTTFSFYRDRLIKNGLITSIGWGFIKFSLPRFKEYIEMKIELE